MIGVFEAVSVAAMVAGAVLAPLLVAATSLRASLLILGAAALAITLLLACADSMRSVRGVPAPSRLVRATASASAACSTASR